MDKHMSVADTKAHLSEIIRQVQATRGTVVIERRGRPVAVLKPWPEHLEQSDGHWSEAIRGIAAVDDGFGEVMEDIIASRSQHQPRRIDFDS